MILALTPSVEGDTTSLYLGRLLKPFCSVSRIAYGLPMGSELEYADEVTLSRALEGRRPVLATTAPSPLPSDCRTGCGGRSVTPRSWSGCRGW